MKRPADTIHHLPTQRAFLVQVRAEADVAQGRLAGRVEHVLSGPGLVNLHRVTHEGTRCLALDDATDPARRRYFFVQLSCCESPGPSPHPYTSVPVTGSKV